MNSPQHSVISGEAATTSLAIFLGGKWMEKAPLYLEILVQLYLEVQLYLDILVHCKVQFSREVQLFFLFEKKTKACIMNSSTLKTHSLPNLVNQVAFWKAHYHLFFLATYDITRRWFQIFFYPYLVKIWLEFFFVFLMEDVSFFFLQFSISLTDHFLRLHMVPWKPQKPEKKPLGLWYEFYFHCMAQGWRKLKPINSADGI